MKDEATVARMAKAIYDKECEQEGFTGQWEAQHRAVHHDYCAQAQAALTTLPSESGLVAALEDLIHQVEGLKQEEAESFDLDQARKALATHRAGNPWSDTPPTELRLGDKVTISPSSPYFEDFREEVVTVHGMEIDRRDKKINYTIDILDNGLSDGWGREDLIPLNPPKGGDT